MTDLSSLIQTLELIAPPELASLLDDGKIGLIVRGSEVVNTIAVAVDPTLTVIQRALEYKANILITHHPLIWTPLTNIPASIHQQLKLALQNNLSLYVMHTNYDAAPGGTNDVLSETLDLQNVKEFGIGRVGIVPLTNTANFAQFVSKKLHAPVQCVGDNKIKKVVVVAGSGFSDTIDDAIKVGADAVVSAELKHSIIRQAEKRLSLIDASHYGTEAPGMLALASKLKAEFIEDAPKLLNI